MGGDTASPSRLLWPPGFVTPTALTVHWMVWLELATPSEAVSVTVYGVVLDAEFSMVPLMVPAAGSMASPGGRPLAV